MLEINQLSAAREGRTLFECLSFRLNAGEVLQIAGRNGSGKTTLLRMVAGLARQDQGEVYWNREKVSSSREAYHSNLLFIGHQTGIKKELTAYENLRFLLSAHANYNHSKQDLYFALMKVGLVGREDVAVAHLSAGQQRRVALARLWLSRQPLWILDEPLTAIDKQGVKVLEQVFLRHASEGGMVMLTTHQDIFLNHDSLRTITLGDKQ
ncbi:cytochrome c biogenesis heme-transporting ATPase CcmA [Vibrio profundum]|uniref:cytochrome c biogenesis heme-transporting ATPase CcmA n=1 Tax=Vibrio profundum TaxID=2910247 RepID=UPI003D12C632